jgi:hypothetical protein
LNSSEAKGCVAVIELYILFHFLAGKFMSIEKLLIRKYGIGIGE